MAGRSKYPAGTRLVLHGKFEARNRFRVQGHARTTEASAGAEAVAHYPATEGLSSTQILALVRAHAGAMADVLEPLPAELRVPERLPERGARARRRAPSGAMSEQALGRRRLAFDELLLVQLALLRRRRLRRQRRHRARARRCARADRPLAVARCCPFTPTGDQLRRSRRSIATSPRRGRCSGC